MVHTTQAGPSSPVALRAPTPLDAVADAYVEESCALDPLMATTAGITGHDGDVTDFSPAGFAARTALARRTLAAVDEAPVVDEVDAVTAAAMRERLGVVLELADAGLDGGGSAMVNVMTSPLQVVRDTFDLMPTDTVESWEAIASRLAQVGDVLAGARASVGAALGGDPALVPTVRQARASAEQCDALADPAAGQLADLVAGAPDSGADASPALLADLRSAVASAAAAFAEHGRWLREDLVASGQARTDDAVGVEAYRLLSRHELGAAIDLEETYAWGLEEVARLEAEMAQTAEAIRPGASVTEAIAVLDADPERRAHGTDALLTWMQELSDASLESLAGTHFDVPEQARTLVCRIAPSSSGGVYYTPPSEDFSRPGAMWWSVPPGVTSFGLWSERTTVFHEGVPGHHLQFAQALARSGALNRWRRLLCWVSGHGEGWALYAERLMADLGWLDDPGDAMGMLEAQLFRAARVVVDIGTHCRFATPAEISEHGGPSTWDADALWTYLRAHTYQAEPVMRFEALRYLGWPGQAPSYKVGERLWLDLREQVRAAEGDAFDLRAFHRRALDLGSVGLDVLREALLP